MNRLRSECPLCGGVELPTGELETRADGREYAAFLCRACGSKGWEWAVGRERVVLSVLMIPWVFFLASFVGGCLMVFSFVFAFMALENNGGFGRAALMCFLGILCLLLSLRPRVLKRHPVSGEVTIAWGKRFPFVYRRLQTSDWKAFVVQKKYPVVVMRSGSSSRASSLPPYYQLSGMTKRHQSVVLARSANLEEMETLRQCLRESSSVMVSPLWRMQVFLDGKSDTPSTSWRQEPFFRKNRRAAALYQALGDSDDWRQVTAVNHYDADNPHQLSCAFFDISLLASVADMRRPWSALEDLYEHGWVRFFDDDDRSADLKKLVDLEWQLPWVTPECLETS